MKKILAAVLGISFAIVPALAAADWQWKWDMSLDEVAKALGVSASSATTVEGSKQLKGPYTSDGRSFEGTFTFEKSKLRGVSLAAVDPTDCLVIRHTLLMEHGNPASEKGSPGIMTLTTWSTATDQIVFSRVGSQSQSSSCVTVYTPR